MGNGLFLVKNWILTTTAVVLAVMVAGAFTAGPAIAQAVRAALVSNVDDPGRIPYRANATLNFGSKQAAQQFFQAVPAGRRLVITNVSGRLSTTNPGGTFISMQVVSTYFPLTFTGLYNGENYFVFHQPTMIVVDAGESLFAAIDLGQITTRGSAYLTFTGYMLDCTTGPCAAIVQDNRF